MDGRCSRKDNPVCRMPKRSVKVLGNGEPDVIEENVEALKALLEGLEPMPDDNIPLYKIVFEETKPYFAGEKTLDQVIDVIQNRMTLYMQEK